MGGLKSRFEFPHFPAITHHFYPLMSAKEMKVIDTVKVENLLTALNSCWPALQTHITSADFNMFMSDRNDCKNRYESREALWFYWEQEASQKKAKWLVGEFAMNRKQ